MLNELAVHYADPESRDRSIDGLRGFAVLSVIACHISELWIRVSATAWHFWHGACGAHLLLIISGFSMASVLANSTDLRTFAIQRFRKVYPIYAISVVISAALIYAFDPPLYTITITQVFTNLTMLQSWLPFGGGDIDGAFWLTGVLLKFYALIGIGVLLQFSKRVDLFVASYLAGLALWRVGVEFGLPLPDAIAGMINVRHAHLFISGMLLWTMYESGLTPTRALAFVVCMGLEVAGTPMPWGSLLIVMLMLVCFCREHLKPLQSKPLCFIGRYSHGIYMLHGVVAYVILKFASAIWPASVVAVQIYAIVILSAVLVTNLPRLIPGNRLRRFVDAAASTGEETELEAEIELQANELLAEVDSQLNPEMTEEIVSN